MKGRNKTGDLRSNMWGVMWGNMWGYMMGASRFLAREGHRHPIGGHLDSWVCDAVLQAGVVNPPDAAADLLHQLHPVEHTEEQGVSGYALAAQVFLFHPGGKSPRRHNLHTVLKDVNLHVGGAAIVAMGDGVHHSLPQGALGQLQPLVSSLCVGNESGVQLGLKLGHHVLIDGEEIPVKLLAVEYMGLGVATEDGADHAGLEREAGDVVG